MSNTKQWEFYSQGFLGIACESECTNKQIETSIPCKIEKNDVFPDYSTNISGFLKY